MCGLRKFTEGTSESTRKKDTQQQRDESRHQSTRQQGAIGALNEFNFAWLLFKRHAPWKKDADNFPIFLDRHAQRQLRFGNTIADFVSIILYDNIPIHICQCEWHYFLSIRYRPKAWLLGGLSEKKDSLHSIPRTIFKMVN